jgi:hypothetical protein
MTGCKQFVRDSQAEVISLLAQEILADDRLVLETLSLKLSENFETNLAKVEVKIIELVNGKIKNLLIQGEGVGLIDAYFDAMIKNYEKNFCSLEHISIVDFRVAAHTDNATQRKSDANVTALLRVKNSDRHEYTFECTTSSISHSSLSVVEEAIAFFLNSELAYKKLHIALINAKERGRPDLIEKYQNQMATLVKATSYEKLVQHINFI